MWIMLSILVSSFELEVVLKSDQSLKEGTIIAEELMTKLGINNRDLD